MYLYFGSCRNLVVNTWPALVVMVTLYCTCVYRPVFIEVFVKLYVWKLWSSGSIPTPANKEPSMLACVCVGL